MNAGTSPPASRHGLLSTALYKLGPAAPTHYALEGAVACCAVGINWFRDALGMIESAPEISDLAAEVRPLNKCQLLHTSDLAAEVQPRDRRATAAPRDRHARCRRARDRRAPQLRCPAANSGARRQRGALLCLGLLPC